MHPSSAAPRAQSASSDIPGMPAPFELRRERHRLVLRTSPASVQRARLATRLLCAVCALTGFGMLVATPWGALIAAAASVAAYVVPGLIRERDLVELDKNAGVLRVHQATAAAGAIIPLSSVREVRGEYEIRGWDPQSDFQAVLDSGERVTLLVLPGTSETLAREAGRSLAMLTNCPVSYVGSDGQAWQLQPGPAFGSASDS